MLRKGRGLVRGTGVVVDGKHHDGYSWAWKKPIITIVIISLTVINNSRFVITNSLNVGNGSLKTSGASGAGQGVTSLFSPDSPRMKEKGATIE